MGSRVGQGSKRWFPKISSDKASIVYIDLQIAQLRALPLSDPHQLRAHIKRTQPMLLKKEYSIVITAERKLRGVDHNCSELAYVF